jgi:phytoene dehydrogenase-like protein
MTEGQKVAIVGAGMAGLTAAAYLAKENYQVTLLEKNKHFGGLVSTFNQDGFAFDTGPRAFVNSGMVKPMLKDLGIEWDYLENKISIGIEDKLFGVDSMESITEYQQILKELFPDNRDEIDQIISVIQELSEYTRILYEFDNPNFGNVMSDRKFIFRELIPWTFQFLKALRKMNKYQMPMEEYLAGFTNNQSLIDIMTQLFFRGTPTHFALGYFYVYLDYFYPKGGTGELPRLLGEKVLDNGGTIKINTQITEVIPSENVVVDSEGNRYDYDHLIWAADLKALYRNITQSGLNPSISKDIDSERGRVQGSKGAESVYIMFITVDQPPSFFASRGGPHMFYSPKTHGMGEIHRGDRVALLNGFETKTKEEVLAWLDEFCENNTFEVSIPALRDSSLAPKGKTGIMISCLFDYELIEKVEAAGWADEFKAYMDKRIIGIFSRTIYPDLSKNIIDIYSSTPLTIHRVSGSSEGAITGWSFETDIPVIDTLKDIPKSVLTPIPNIYKAGQWAYAPSGVPIAMLTGWYATQKIIKK